MIASVAPDNEPAALQAWNRFTASLDRACVGVNGESPYRVLLDRLCHGRDEIVHRMTPQIEVWGRSDSLDEAAVREVVAIHADLDRLAERDDVEAAAHIESMARSSRNALLAIISGIVAFVCTSLIAAALVLRMTNPYRRDLLRETIEALPAGVVLYDAKERLVMFNGLAAELSPGADLAKSIGRTYAELAAENGRKLEAMGQGPQPVDEWVTQARLGGRRTTGLGDGDGGGRCRGPKLQRRAGRRRRDRAAPRRAGAARQRALRYGGRDGRHHGARAQPAPAGDQPRLRRRRRGA